MKLILLLSETGTNMKLLHTNNYIIDIQVLQLVDCRLHAIQVTY